MIRYTTFLSIWLCRARGSAKHVLEEGGKKKGRKEERKLVGKEGILARREEVKEGVRVN